MRYLVIAGCEDLRTGKLFEAGDEFLPEPDIDQAERLIAARCLRPMPNDAPVLPGTDEADRKLIELEADNDRLSKANDELLALVAKGAIDAGVAQSAADKSIADLTADRDALLGRVAELEKDLAEATKPSTDQSGGDTAEQATAKPAKSKG